MEYNPNQLPMVTTVTALKVWFLSYIANMLVSNGVESSFTVIKETASGRASRQSIKQTISSNFNSFCKAMNFENDSPFALAELCENVIDGKVNLQDILRDRVVKLADDDEAKLVTREPKAIVKAVANINTQLRKKAIELFNLTGKDENGELWNTLTFSNDEIFAMFQTEARNNLTARKTVKIVKRSELEKQLETAQAEIAELKAMVATA